jgi:hypothetical protein
MNVFQPKTTCRKWIYSSSATAGETLSKVAAVFEVSRSAVYRHQKHFAERILVGREGAAKVMQDVQAWADKYKLPVADTVAPYWPHEVSGHRLWRGTRVGRACPGMQWDRAIPESVLGRLGKGRRR